MSSSSSSDLEPIPEVLFTAKYPSTIVLKNVGYIGKIVDGFSINNQSTCCCCLESTCCGICCIPWYCCEVCFCHSGFCTDASIKLDDTTRTVDFTVWNWYLPCTSCTESISYDKIADVGYHRIELIDMTLFASPTGIAPTNKHTGSYFHPMIKTTNNKLYEFKTGTYSSVAFNQKWMLQILLIRKISIKQYYRVLKL